MKISKKQCLSKAQLSSRLGSLEGGVDVGADHLNTSQPCPNAWQVLF